MAGHDEVGLDVHEAMANVEHALAVLPPDCATVRIARGARHLLRQLNLERAREEVVVVEEDRLVLVRLDTLAGGADGVFHVALFSNKIVLELLRHAVKWLQRRRGPALDDVDRSKGLDERLPNTS